MRTFAFGFAIVVAVGLTTAPASLQEVITSPYDVVDGWMTPFADDGYAFGSHPGVFAESPDRIFVIQRGEIQLPDPLPSGWAGFVGSIGISALNTEEGPRAWRNCIFIVDGDGNLIDAWNQWDDMVPKVGRGRTISLAGEVARRSEALARLWRPDHRARRP